MPRLSRSDWYDLSRDTNWTFRYAAEGDVFPEDLSGTGRVPGEAWLKWDELFERPTARSGGLAQILTA